MAADAKLIVVCAHALLCQFSGYHMFLGDADRVMWLKIQFEDSSILK